MTKDMTQGSPLRLILAFAVPLMLGSLFQQFYNLADTIIVGRFVGVDALAAVGSVGGLNYLVLGFVNGIACGFSIPISWTFGAKDYREMRRYTANTVWLSLFFAVVLTVVTVALTRAVLVWTNTPETSSTSRTSTSAPSSGASPSPCCTTSPAPSCARWATASGLSISCWWPAC